MKDEQVYFFDFETTLSEPAEVWLWGACDFDLNVETGRTILDFFDYVEEVSLRKKVTYFYAYNAKFDFSFILCGLPKTWEVREVFCAGMMRTFRYAKLTTASGKKIEIRDASPLFSPSPIDLKKVYKSWAPGFKKGDTPLLQKPPKIIKEEWQIYVEDDVLGLATAVKKRWEILNHRKLTTSSDIKTEIEKKDELFCVKWEALSIEEDRELRSAYRGGISYLEPRFSEQILHNVKVYDVNSMYPSIMLGDLPAGRPKFEKGRLRPKIGHLFLQKINIIAVCKPDFLPVLPLKTGVSYVYTREIFGEFYLTDKELAYVLKAYEIQEIEYLEGCYFVAYPTFNKYVHFYEKLKTQAPKNSAERELYKLFLNAPSGKWGQRPDGDTFEIILKDGVPAYQKIEKDDLDPFHLPTSIFITSYARVKLANMAHRCGYENFIYADTDSIHLLDDSLFPAREKHETQLGKWDLEKVCERAKYLRSKRYCLEVQGELHFTCAGVKPKWFSKWQNKSLENFRTGLVLEGQVMRFCRGGMRMIDSHKEI